LVTLISIASDPAWPSFKGCLNALSEYEVTMSRVERETTAVLLLRLAKDGSAITGSELRELIHELGQSLASCPR
jgi:hypothetical protein